MFYRVLSFAVVASLCAGLAACSSDKTDKYVERPVSELYNQAMDAMEADKFEREYVKLLARSAELLLGTVRGRSHAGIELLLDLAPGHVAGGVSH